jgi:hypothetical protein|tara:strand:- start:6195 stop:6971 length:777 start_codon:yes stop_codon:yes gene_type:complete
MSKQVKKADNNLPSTDVMDLFTSHEGEGLDYDTSELQIPFIRIIQALSPEINKRDPKFIDGASNGDIFNNVTGQYFNGEEGIVVIPCYQETKYLKFTPRDSGGGFLGEIAKGDPEIAKAVRTGAKEILPDGNELVKSDQHYCLVLASDGIPSFGIVDMKSSQLKVSKRWKTQISMLTKEVNGQLKRPPIFLTMWKLSTVEERNDQGAWFNWSIANAGHVENKEIANMALNFRKSVMSGEAKAVAEDVVTEPAEQHSAF